MAQQHAGVDRPVVDALVWVWGGRWVGGEVGWSVGAWRRGPSAGGGQQADTRQVHAPGVGCTAEPGAPPAPPALSKRPKTGLATPPHPHLLRLLDQRLPEELPGDVGHVPAGLLQGLVGWIGCGWLKAVEGGWQGRSGLSWCRLRPRPQPR